MLKAKIDHVGVHVVADGDLCIIASDLCTVINSLYNQLSRSEPALGDLFRRVITGVVTDADTPVWEIRDAGSGVCIRIPKNIKEEM